MTSKVVESYEKYKYKKQKAVEVYAIRTIEDYSCFENICSQSDYPCENKDDGNCLCKDTKCEYQKEKGVVVIDDESFGIFYPNVGDFIVKENGEGKIYSAEAFNELFEKNE